MAAKKSASRRGRKPSAPRARKAPIAEVPPPPATPDDQPAAAPAELPEGEPRKIPTNRGDLTALQRERVLELYAKSDRRIADQMIREGLFVQPADCESEDDVTRFKDSCRRTVNNHRRAIKEEWALLEPVQLGDPVATQEFIARLRSRVDEVDDIIHGAGTKPTAKVNALAEVRQLETLIGKATGVDIDWKRYGKTDDPDGDNGQAELPFVGLLIDMKNVSEKARKEIQRERRQPGDGRRGRGPATARPKVSVQR